MDAKQMRNQLRELGFEVTDVIVTGDKILITLVNAAEAMQFMHRAQHMALGKAHRVDRMVVLKAAGAE